MTAVDYLSIRSEELGKEINRLLLLGEEPSTELSSEYMASVEALEDAIEKKDSNNRIFCKYLETSKALDVSVKRCLALDEKIKDKETRLSDYIDAYESTIVERDYYKDQVKKLQEEIDGLSMQMFLSC